MKGGLFDNHSHSYFSADSRMDIVDAVKTAYERGLSGLCLTDHLDFDPPAGVADFTFDVPSQQTAIDEDVEFLGLNGRGGKYGDFQLLKGVEIGLQDKSMSTIRKILADNRFDCVIASLHLIDGHDPYFGDYYKPYDWRYAYGHYLEEFDRLIRVMPDFDILGHYDYLNPDFSGAERQDPGDKHQDLSTVPWKASGTGYQYPEAFPGARGRGRVLRLGCP